MYTWNTPEELELDGEYIEVFEKLLRYTKDKIATEPRTEINDKIYSLSCEILNNMEKINETK